MHVHVREGVEKSPGAGADLADPEIAGQCRDVQVHAGRWDAGRE